MTTSAVRSKRNQASIASDFALPSKTLPSIEPLIHRFTASCRATRSYPFQKVHFAFINPARLHEELSFASVTSAIQHSLVSASGRVRGMCSSRIASVVQRLRVTVCAPES